MNIDKSELLGFELQPRGFERCDCSSQAKEAKVEAKSALDAMKEAGHCGCFFGVASSNLVLKLGNGGLG